MSNLTTFTHANTGLSLVEALVTLSIVAIVATIAIPNISHWIASWQVRHAVEQIQSSLNFARSEAIKRGASVVIQKTSESSCTNSSNTRDWSCGWNICTDNNNNNVCDTNEEILQRIHAQSRVQILRTGGSTSIRFNRWGFVSGTYLGFTVTSHLPQISTPVSRSLFMSSGGRIRTE